MSNTPLTEKRFLKMLLGSWLAWLLVHAYLLRAIGLPLSEAFADSIITNILLLGFGFLIINNLQYYMPRKDRFWFILSLSFFVAALAWLCTKGLLGLLPFSTAYQQFLVSASPIRFWLLLLLCAFLAVISMLWYDFADRERAARRKNETAQLAKEAELMQLRQQLQPHFLFNSLNSVNALIGSRPQEARQMIQQLSSFLRNTVRRKEDQWISFAEELEHLQLYLSIEEVRFGNRLKIEFDIEDAALDWPVPALLLQPLVENAIKFGLYGTLGETTIVVRAKVLDGLLTLTVENPFDADSAPAEKGTGFGLNGVKRRVELLFGRIDLVKVAITNNYFIVVLNIPQKKLA